MFVVVEDDNMWTKEFCGKKRHHSLGSDSTFVLSDEAGRDGTGHLTVNRVNIYGRIGAFSNHLVNT